MKNIFINIILIFITLTTQAQAKKTELENRNGIYYEIGKDIPFTGQSYAFYTKNKKKSFTQYVDGKLNGEMKNWYPNGETQVYGEMFKGKKHGVWTAWFSNGNKLREGTYKNNKEEGVFTWWYEDGNIKKKGLYQNGITNGQWTWYFSNGEKESEGNLLNNKNIGKWIWWNKKGEIIHEKDFSSEFNNSAFKNLEKLLIGKWTFIQAVNKENKKVDYFVQDYKGFEGKEIKVIANGPEIIINKDHSYLKKFTEENSDIGTWEIITKNEIQFEIIIPMDSPQGKMILQTQKMLNKKWEEDTKGNFIDLSTDKIIIINETEMKIDYRNKYTLIYKRN